MTDFKNYFKLDNQKDVIKFGDKEYKINKSYKITLYLNQKQKEIDKAKKEDSSFDEVQANFDLIFESFSMICGKEFSDMIKDSDISESALMNLFQIIINMRQGMSEKEAIKAVEETEKKMD